MKTPICNNCLTAEELCEECDAKRKTNLISQTDITISKYLQKLEDNLVIRSTDFEKAFELEDFIILVVNGDVGTLIGKGGRVVKLLSERFGKKIRVIKKGKTRDMIQDLISPAMIQGVNIIYSQSGEKQKIIIPAIEKKKIFMSEKTLNNAVNAMFGGTVIISYV